MALTYEFLTARADEAAREAKNAKLENVRLRAERSEAAWRDMASRALRIQQDRTAREREKERERQEAESQTA